MQNRKCLLETKTKLSCYLPGIGGLCALCVWGGGKSRFLYAYKVHVGNHFVFAPFYLPIFPPFCRPDPGLYVRHVADAHHRQQTAAGELRYVLTAEILTSTDKYTSVHIR